MRRIAILGTSGSGKTFLAAEVARLLGSVHIELDALHWQPGWTPTPPDCFREKVLVALTARDWVTDGNYRSVRDLVWAQADSFVWLNYRLSVVLGRLLRRTARRAFSGEECCNGNRESLALAFSRESVVLWALRTHGGHRRDYPRLLAGLAAEGKTVVIHHSPAETRAWLETIRQSRQQALV